jgi:GNAT superfamily N-acetyltransferase
VNPPHPTIRRATPADLPAAADILAEAARWLVSINQPLWTAEHIAPEKLLPYIHAGELHLALLDSHPVGTMLLQWQDPTYWPHVPPGESAFVHRLAVRRSVAGQGISRALLAHAEAAARAANKRYLRLDCAPRPKLCQVYESAGFTPKGERDMGAYRTVLYEKSL